MWKSKYSERREEITNKTGTMRYYLALGSNLGNREAYFRNALQWLGKMGQVLKKSALYSTEPYGYSRQESFLNAVVLYETNLRPFRLLRKLKQVELALGRIMTCRWGERPIDIDIVDWNGGIIESPVLKIPHCDLHNRRFVLQPLSDIKADYSSREGTVVNNLPGMKSDTYKVDVIAEKW